MGSKSPKVAIIGNMNNVGFVLLRLLRDMGVDAHLVLYANDGTGDSSHFSPENDDSKMERWEPFISRSKIPDHLISTVSWPLGVFYWVLIAFAHLLGESSRPPRIVLAKEIEDQLEGFEFIIGSGPAPALLRRIGRRLDVFWAYSTGVEYLAGVPFLERNRRFYTAFFKMTAVVRSNQEQGIREASASIVGLDEGAYQTLRNLRVEPRRLFIPMVYGAAPNSSSPACRADAQLMRNINEDFEIVCFSAVRQYWDIKQNDMFLRGFFRFLEASPKSSACLVLIDYGPDVEQSKHLIEDLGFSERVFWLPRKGRMDIRYLSSLADLSIGQFDRGATSWGCVGWEALADGRPLMTGFNWEEGEFQKLSGMPPPPILGVSNEGDVLAGLQWAALNKDQLLDLGAKGQKWYQRWQGTHVVDQWRRLIIEKGDDSNSC